MHVESRDYRVLALSPRGEEASTVAMLGEAGIATHACATLDELSSAIESGAGAVVMGQESLPDDPTHRFAVALRGQPAWSDLPVFVLTRADDLERAFRSTRALGNVTLLARPIAVATLVSAVRSELRARQRQYEVRDRSEALRDALRRQDEFLATLAHELRNPLAPIRNSLHILKLAGDATPAAEHVCAMMQRQIDHMVRLVDDLMEVSRITRGKIELHRATIDLADVIHTAIESTRPMIEAARHHVSVELPHEPLVVSGDFVRLSQVFANLLSNACKYTESGGTIRVVGRSEGSNAVVIVADDGIGIPAEMLPRVFDLFVQAERSSPRSQGGLGIGLTLTRGLVRLHGG
jgi:signal transduction histidine kinase